MFVRVIRIAVFVLMFATGLCAHAIDLAQERHKVDEWHRTRIERLISPTGWVTLVGIYWLKEGDNDFGRAERNALALNHASLPETLGTFVVKQHSVTFVAKSQSVVTHAGERITRIEMQPDSSEQVTVLAVGTLEFFVIERSGKLAVRVRDTEDPVRKSFLGIERYPVSLEWVLEAKFEPYNPVHHVDVVNILGFTEKADSPGAIVFEKNGKRYRLETILESPNDDELFVMFADATSGRETYGAGRFLYTSLPHDGRVTIDFNKAYNPPCAFTDFATCPLPLKENRLSLRVKAGEKKYLGNEH
jgi:uncharacterized protein